MKPGRNARREAEELVGQLAGLPLFAGCSHPDLEALARAGRLVRLPAGWTIMATDTPADSVYILLSGQTVVTRDGTLLAEVGPGAVLGEAALIEGKLRSATVSAKTPIQLLRVGYEEMTGLLERHPGLQHAIYAAYEERHLPQP